MKVKVLRTFRNKYSKKIHKKGDTIDISKKRFEEINSAASGVLVEKIEDKK